MRMTRFIRCDPNVLLFVVLLVIFGSSTFAQGPPQQAWGVTQQALGDLASGNLRNLYHRGTSPRFRMYYAEQSFITEIRRIKGQLGGRALNRTLVNASMVPSLQTPQGSTIPGNFAFFRYRAVHRNAVVFEDFYLEQIPPDGAWRIVGLWIIPGY